jgi:phage-related protein
MSLTDQVATVNFGSISSAGTGIRSLNLDLQELGPAVGAALALSPTRGLRAARGLLETAADIDQGAVEVGALVEWAAREGKHERTVVADAMRISGGELLLVDRVSRLPRTEARAFVADWLEAGGDRRAVATWLATVGSVLREHQDARPQPGDSGGVVRWIKDAAEDVIDAITEAVETIIDAVIEAGQALADVLSEVVSWTIEQVGNLVEALLEAGMTLAELVADAVEAGVTLFKKVVKALIEIGQTVATVLGEIVSQTVGVIGDAIRALREIGIAFGTILRDAFELAATGFRKVVEALIDIGRSVVQILEAAITAAVAVVRATLEALLAIGRTMASLVADVVTGRRGLIDAFTSAMREIGRSVSDLLDAARDAVAGAVRTIARSLADIGASIVDLAEWAAGAAVGLARDVIAALVEAGKRVVELVTSVAQRAIRVMRAVIDGLFALGRTFAQLLRDVAGIAQELLERFLEAAFSLGATIIEFVSETLRNTYAAAKRMIEAAVRAGAAIGSLLVEAAKGTYFTLRKMVFGLMDLVGLGEIVRWAAERLENFAENVFHEVMTAIRYAGGRLVEVLEWAVDQSLDVFKAVIDAWESVRENLITLYRWAGSLVSNLADEAWARIGRATVRFQNSVSYALTYLEKDFLPGVRRFVHGLLDAGYEVADLVARVMRRSVQFVAEAVQAMLELGVTVTELLVATMDNPRTALDNLVAALREVGTTWRDIMAAAEEARDDIVDEVIETARRLEEPLNEMLAGALEVGGGLLGLVVAKLFNLLATYRPLTEAEKAAAAPVFGPSLDLDLISISAESLDNDIIFAVQDFFSDSPDARAFVTGTLINMDARNPITTATLIHELTHVWQHFETGPMYLSEAIHAQVTEDDAYNYGYTNADNGDGAETALQAAAGDFESFNREQQGQIVMHYYVRRFEEGRPEAEWTDWQPYIDVVQAA